MHDLQYHSCAVLSVGAVSCWGYNLKGQVIARAWLRECCACAGRRCGSDDMLSAAW